MDEIGLGYCKSDRLCVWTKAKNKAGKALVEYPFLHFTIESGSFLETCWLKFCNGERQHRTAYEQATAGLRSLASIDKSQAAFVIRILKSGINKPPSRNEMREFFCALDQSITAAFGHLSVLRPSLLNSRLLFRSGIDAWFEQGVLDYRYHDIKDFLDKLPIDPRSTSMSLSSFEDRSSKSPEAITNLPFKTIEEAREKQGEHLDIRLAELQEKCFSALDYWTSRKITLTDLSTCLSPTRLEEIQRIVAPHRKGWLKDPRDHLAIQALEPKDLAAFYLSEFIQQRLHVYANMMQFLAAYKTAYPHGERVIDYFSQTGIKGFSHRMNFFPELLCSLAYFGATELVAIQTLILSETGFNPQPLQDLHITQCRRDKTGGTARWELMPIKSKTGKGQDQSLASTADATDAEGNTEYVAKQVTKKGEKPKKTAFDAMEMLIANYNHLVEHGSFAPGSEGYLFTYPTRISNMQTQRRIGTWGKVFEAFKKDWNINSQYTFKQLRNQVGAREVVRSNGNLYAVRSKLGHASIATSAGYVAHVLAEIDDAIINQFERQIAATILFAIGGEDLLYTHNLCREDVNIKTIPIVTLKNQRTQPQDIEQKLTPVGNGVGCANPTDSPNHTINRGDFCDAGQCYDCRHRRIIITKERMKENILLLRYFRNNLDSICARNPEHWVKHGVKSFAFQIALSHVIRSNLRYKKLYEEIEQEITEAEDLQRQQA